MASRITARLGSLRPLALFLGIAFLSAVAPAAYGQLTSTDQVDDLAVEVTRIFPGSVARGFVPVLVSLRNDGLDSREAVMKLGAQWGNDMSKSRQVVQWVVPPGDDSLIHHLFNLSLTHNSMGEH